MLQRSILKDVHSKTFLLGKNKKESKCLSVKEWISELLYVYAMEYCTTVKINKLVLY